MGTTKRLWTVLLVILAWSGGALAQDRASMPLPPTWGPREVVERVNHLDPRLRLTAARQLVAHVEERRARWNRIQGQGRLHAGHQLGTTGWFPTSQMDRHTSDHATVAAVVDLRLPLYAGGRISADLDAARASVRKAQHDEASLRLELATAALVVYAEVLAAQERVRVSDRALSRARQLLQMTEKRRRAGIDTEADVARAQLNLVRYEEELAVQQSTLRTALATLRSVLLLEDRVPMLVVGSLSELATVHAMGGAHPDVARAHAALDEARARSRSAGAAYLPNVDLFATGQYGNTFPGDTTAPMHAQRFGPLSASGAVGVQAGWTLFDFFATRDQVESTQAEVALRRADRDVAVFLLESRRKQAIAREHGARERLGVLRNGQHAASRALELARARYDTGHATLTDVLTADLEGIRLQSNQVQASLELALARIDRLHAEGAHP